MEDATNKEPILLNFMEQTSGQDVANERRQHVHPATTQFKFKRLRSSSSFSTSKIFQTYSVDCRQPGKHGKFLFIAGILLLLVLIAMLVTAITLVVVFRQAGNKNEINIDQLKEEIAILQGQDQNFTDQGDEGTWDTLKAGMDKLQNILYSLILGNPDNLVDLCGLGIKSGAIPDANITASSQWSSDWVASRGRLDHPTHCWHAKPSAVGQWIQIDFGKQTVITGVVTQGRPSFAQWVKSYKIACMSNVDNLTWFMDDGAEKVFTGNTDFNTKVASILPTPISCRYVRLYPQSWNGMICMRMELLGEDCLPVMP